LKSYVDPKSGNMPFFEEGQKEYEVISDVIVPSTLLENYPNPFNPITVLSYQLSAVSNVTLKVYDVLGREVATLADGIKDAGYYSATFDTSHLSSGIYFARLTATPIDGSKPFIAVKKMLLTK
jgi:hypothetical protein